MKYYFFVALLIVSSFISFGQTPNAFANYSEFKNNSPSLIFDFKLKQRTNGDVFMTGGITNYRVKDVLPDSNVKKMEEEIWGVKVNDTIYINSYPYSKRKGYNEIIEKGYYTYFVGEPAWESKEQKELGFIKPDAKKSVKVSGKVGYVILPDGTVKLLKPDYLLELCKDNQRVVSQIKSAGLQQENVLQMFKCLKMYNEAKK